jgi:AcrR family transcriptional regulator
MNLVQTLNMVQEAGGTVGRRARNRLERHRAFLQEAKAIVAAEGLDALTMARLADRLDCAVGTAYTYFPSKSALVAEVQRDAIETLTESYVLFRARFDAQVAASGPPEDVAAAAHLVGFARFWIATLTAYPEEARLLQVLMADPGTDTIVDDDLNRVVPAAMRLLEHARDAFAAARVAGLLSAGADPGTVDMERTVVLAATLNGVLLLDRLARVDPTLLDGHRLALATTLDLLRAWGAEDGALAAAGALVDELAAAGPLAPPLPREAR